MTLHATRAAVRRLPPVAIEGHRSSGSGGPDHPMRLATRRAAGLDAGGWTAELRGQVEAFFTDLAGEWHTRISSQRTGVVRDALVRGLDPLGVTGRLAVEVGSGVGAYSGLLAERFATVVAADLSMAMLRAAPAEPARRVRSDAAALPVRDRSAAAVVLINAFLFPAEVERVLSSRGALVWVNTSAEETPIYLSVEDLMAALPGAWRGSTSRAGAGYWCVLQRA